MRKKILIDQITKELNYKIIHKGEKDYVCWPVASGLMSDILTTEEEEILLISNLTTSQVIRTADMVGANAILFTNGKPIAAGTIELAKELNFTTLSTELPLFETCLQLGKLFSD